MKVVFLALAMMGISRLAAQQILTDIDVVKMVQAGVAEDVVLKLVAESPVQFSLAPDHVIAWKKAGVPDEITRAMMARQQSAPRIEYVHFSSEVRVIPVKPKRGRWSRLKVWHH